jgi:hypothetical protein
LHEAPDGDSEDAGDQQPQPRLPEMLHFSIKAEACAVCHVAFLSAALDVRERDAAAAASCLDVF